MFTSDIKQRGEKLKLTKSQFCVLSLYSAFYRIHIRSIDKFFFQGSVWTVQDTSPPCRTAVIALLVRPCRNALLCNHDNRELKEDVDVRVGVGAGELVQDLLRAAL